jgi:hypothetical protein
MMTEILKARDILSEYIKERKKTHYDYKRECIEKALYGVDIDPGAVEIAKLRLWLSLVVDEDDIENIKPLPNLDYKIVCGDSLLGFPDNWNSQIEKEIELLIHDHFNETDPVKKNEFKKRIENKIKTRYKSSEKIFGYKINFDFNTIFSEVFRKKGGFDIIIANPPYITIALGKQQKFFTKDMITILKDKYKQVFEYKGNTYSLFFDRSRLLLNKYGILTFITPNTLLLNSTFSKTREYLLKYYGIEYLINITDKVFEEVEIGGNLITVLKKLIWPDHIIKFKELYDLNQLSQELSIKFIAQESFKHNYEFKFYFNHISNNILEKIKKDTIPLGNIVKFYQGIITGDNSKYLSDRKISNMYHKILRGRDINKYTYTFSGTYVLFDKDKLWSNTNERFFRCSQKLISRQTCDSLIAAYDDKKFLTLDSTHVQILINDDYNLKYILALFNSKLLNYIYNQFVQEGGRVFAQVKTVNLKPLPIKIINETNQKPFVQLIDAILKNKELNKDTSQEENEIDKLVYKLYGLDDEEIKIVEESIKK